MNPIVSPARAGIFVAACSLLLTGCASSGRRFYSGDPRPVDEVAVLDLRYLRSGTYSTERSQSVSFQLLAEPGHVYYVFPEFPSPGTWRPVIVDVARDGDYEKIEAIADAKRVDVESPGNLRLGVKHYLEGERTPLSKTEFQTRDGAQSLWR